MDCLLAKCIPCITDCVMGELEKLGGKYKIALRLAKDPRFERIPCSCKGCYADDCLTNMVKQWRCFIVATCDKELRGRIRKIPGVPCMYISGYKYTVEVSQCPGLAARLIANYECTILTIFFQYSECRKLSEHHAMVRYSGRYFPEHMVWRQVVDALLLLDRLFRHSTCTVLYE
jgi:rRNA-processing protein FCF1